MKKKFGILSCLALAVFGVLALSVNYGYASGEADCIESECKLSDKVCYYTLATPLKPDVKCVYDNRDFKHVNGDEEQTPGI